MDSVSEVVLDLPGGSFVLVASVAAFAQIERDASYTDPDGKRVVVPYHQAVAAALPPKTIDESCKFAALFATAAGGGVVKPEAVMAAMGNDLASISKVNAAIMEALYAALPVAARKRMNAPSAEGGSDAPADPQR